ncbi:MAG: S1-like domain-containing RNA-binding protein, partial [Kofleriaceae bacterium]
MIEDLLGRRVRLRLVEGTWLQPDETAAALSLIELRDGPATLRDGDWVDVFVYLDSEDRPVATVTPALLALGEVRFLEVTAVTPIGAFVDWGLGKELLVPFAQQSKELFVGERQPIGLYLDKSKRLAGTMFVGDLLVAPREVALGDWLVGEAWRNDPDIGLFAILER